MRRALITLGITLGPILAAAACADSRESGSGLELADLDSVPDAASDLDDAVTVPSASPAPVDPALSGASLAMLDADGRLGVVREQAVSALRDGWRSTVSLDGSYAVSTVMVGDGDTKVAWDALPAGDVLGGAVFEDSELIASTTQVGGMLTAFVNPAGHESDETISGGRRSTTVVLASPDGRHARFELDGNIVPEAFGRTLGADGLPAQMFVLEYTPAEAPTQYRVRVLNLQTGELGLPLSLRDKLGAPVDQEMAGVSRAQVLSSDSGLLFTLYRGTDDMPEGHPYAFVHTLDLADGVWCLDLDPGLELEHLPGALAVFGDRLYVASANGMVGAFDIDSIVNPEAAPRLEWVTRVVDTGGDDAPVLVAGRDGLLAAWPSLPGLHPVSPDGVAGAPVDRPAGAEAIALVADQPIVIGDTWWDLGARQRPDWLTEITRVVAVPG